jgi:hypothetical protein
MIGRENRFNIPWLPNYIPTEFVTVPDAVRLSGCFPGSIVRAVLNGKIMGHKQEGRWKLDKSSFEKWAAKRKRLTNAS